MKQHDEFCIWSGSEVARRLWEKECCADHGPSECDCCRTCRCDLIAKVRKDETSSASWPFSGGVLAGLLLGALINWWWKQ